MQHEKQLYIYCVSPSTSIKQDANVICKNPKLPITTVPRNYYYTLVM